MVKALDCNLQVSEFKLQSHNYIYFQTKKPFIPPPRASYELNDVTTVNGFGIK